MENNDYNQQLQSYIDKIKSLKEWLHSSVDEETKKYLQLEIDKKLQEMKLLTDKKKYK
jgi:hypothetical protein